MILANSKHERFAQSIAKGISAVDAYISAGYAKGNARSNATRLSANDGILARINELKTAVAAGVVAAEIRQRSWRVQQLQGLADDMLALRAARKILYGGQLGEGRIRQVNSPAEETAALAEGYREDPDLKQPTRAKDTDLYPKNLLHPGFPNGGATGMLVKDYRGKNAEQEIWKFDGGLVAKILDTLKQAAIEEGQWTEKREMPGTMSISFIRERLNAGRDRAAKRAADAAKLSA